MSYAGETELWREPNSERQVFLSTLPAGHSERRLALVVVLVSAVIFLAAVPFAKQPLGQVSAFIPIYQSALVVIDLITAVLLFGQFSIRRSRALFVLASGYLFTAFMTVAHGLTFPGAFSPTGLLGAGSQTTAWMYMLWHSGFPLVVIAYALLKDDDRDAIVSSGLSRRPTGTVILCGVAAVGVIVYGLTFVATAGHAALPAIMLNNSYTPTMIGVISSVWVLSLIALAALWRRRPHSVLNLWLMVVMCAWIFDIGLSAVFNAGRYDLGFYVGRIYGLLAASFVLIVLLLENGLLYARLVESHQSERAASKALRDAKRTAEDATQAKSMFLATMSHEIRTPLSGLLGMLELLGISKLDEQQRQFLDAARESGTGLVRIIDDVLDHAKMQAGKLAIRPEPASIAQIVRRVMTSYFAVASAKDLALKEVVDERISPALLADPTRVAQILGNFLSNAIKFTDRGYVEIRADLISRVEGKETVRLSVRDTGIGISPEAQTRLFQPFEQAGVDTSRMYGGTGLGLAISRRLAEMMGGDISMESELGKGTTMALTLTLSVADAVPVEGAGRVTRAYVAPSYSSSGSASPFATVAPLVLAVDDHPINRRLLVGQLNVLGLRVQAASNGKEAFAQWRESTPSLVITDCNMPEMDGYALSRAIREAEAKEGRASRTPVIAWTANVLPSAAAQCQAAGMDDILSKPADLARLKEMLSKWIHWVPSAMTDEALPLEAGQNAPGAAPAAPIDAAQLATIATSPDERTEVLQDFLAQTRADLQQLEQAHEKQDATATALIAHRIKGASRTVGARHLAAVCERMEIAVRREKIGELAPAMAALREGVDQVTAYAAIGLQRSKEKG